MTVYCEKENINTETLTTELMVSVSVALAQQESISISQNQRIRYKRRMERGEFVTCCTPPGYRIVDGKNLDIVEGEAKIVRWIFQQYPIGESTDRIAEKLNQEQVPAPGGGIWRHQTVTRTISNEKYIGDALCQKTYMIRTCIHNR